MPEFEQCRLAARNAGVPLKVVEEAARLALLQNRERSDRTQLAE
jgi:uncharacterized protein (DUF111 family)